MQLPVFITLETEGSKVSISGLVSEVSRSGMAVYAGVNAQPGELIHADFRPSTKLRIAAVVRSRSGYCIGLGFLNTTTGNQGNDSRTGDDRSRGDERHTAGMHCAEA